MNKLTVHEQLKSWGQGGVCVAITLGFTLGALSACSDLLEVELPAQLGDTVLEDPLGAETAVNSVIGQFEDAYDDFAWELQGLSDGCEGLLNSPGIFLACLYSPFGDFDWYIPLQISRNFAFNLHNQLESEWTVEEVPRRDEFLAITSLYAGAALTMMGGVYCEVTIDGGPLMTPEDTYVMAEEWLTQAISEIQSAGDFKLPYGVSSSALITAYAQRAQLRWMAGDDAGALADAQQVPKGFFSWVTRESGPDRRNTAAFYGPLVKYQRLVGVNDWWTGADRTNPLTGEQYPIPVPWTGYLNLGILPDGRAVRDDGLPIRTEGPYRTVVEDDAVRDHRLLHIQGIFQGSAEIKEFHTKYTSEDDDVPWIDWKEIWLIRAELQGGQTAIDLVNELRAEEGLPLVTYADPSDDEDIRFMIIEERRRALYAEGKYYYTKLRNLELMWFPRAQSTAPAGGDPLGGGIRMVMPNAEFELNRNLTLADRGTGCAPEERAVQIDRG